jgi:putative inorganic carbon (HCO3(-)) transporter
MFGLFELVTVVLIAFVVCEQCARPYGLRTIVQCLDWTLVLQSTLIIVMFATGVQLSLSHGVSGADYAYAETGRFAGTLGTPSAAASLLVICILSLVCRIVDQAPGIWRLWMGCQIALGAFAVLITQTRSAWIGLVLGVGGIAWSFSRRGKLGSRQLLQLLGLLLLAIMLAWPFIAGRVAGTHGGDAEIRWNLVLSAIEMIKAHPLVGVGLNCATQVVFHYAALAGVAGSWVFIVHNQFLLLWAEAGILAFVSFIALFKGALARAWGALNSTDPARRTPGAWIFWSLIVMIQMLSLDHVSGAATYKLAFLVLGIGFSFASRLPDAGAPAAAVGARG